MILEGGRIRIDLRPVSSLLPHEDTIPEQLDKLAAQIRKDGVQKDPLIVDRDSGAVLDGMHRLNAFSKLGLENVVCCLVEYSSPGIELRRWARVYKSPQRGLVSKSLKELGVGKAVSISDAFESLDSRRCELAALDAAGCLIPERQTGLRDAFRLVRALDTLGRTLGWERSFVREDEVDVALQDEGNVIVLVQRLTKQDVLDAARSRNLFPCKTSMHMIDPRPVALDFPIGELNSATKESLTAIMKQRSPKTLPPDSTYEGRRYKERLLLLDPR
jgi:hypothetical protein